MRERDPTRRVGDELTRAVGLTIERAEAVVEQVGFDLEAAVASAIHERARRRRVRRIALASAFVAAAAAYQLAVGFSNPDSNPDQAQVQGPPASLVRLSRVAAVATSSRLTIYVPRSRARSGCFRIGVAGRVGRSMCPAGKASDFATYAVVGDRGKVAFFGRAALPRAVRVILRFPGDHVYKVDLQRYGFWAWDGAPRDVALDRRKLIVLAVATHGRIVARDLNPRARRYTVR